MYTYLIGWTSLDRWYYGVRYAKKSTPAELWRTYFTSSRYVKEFRKKYGEPDIMQIRKTFEDKDVAILWENRVLRRMDVIHSQRWLNRTDNKAIRDGSRREYGPSWNRGKLCPRTTESIEKQRKTITGKKRGPYSGFDYSRAVPVTFRGISYRSVAAARAATGASFYTIKRHAASAKSTASSSA